MLLPKGVEEGKLRGEIDDAVIEWSKRIHQIVERHRNQVVVESSPGKAFSPFVDYILQTLPSQTNKSCSAIKDLNTSTQYRFIKESVSRLVRERRLIPYKVTAHISFRRRILKHKVTFYRPATVLEMLASA